MKHRIFPVSELMPNSPNEERALGLRSHPVTCSQSSRMTSVPTFDMLSVGRKGLIIRAVDAKQRVTLMDVTSSLQPGVAQAKRLLYP